MTQAKDPTRELAEQLAAPIIADFKEQKKRIGDLRDHQRNEKITRGAAKIYAVVARFKV